MSSEYGAKSLAELKDRAKQQMAAASRTTNTVNLTEENWRGLVGVLHTQNERLEQMETLLSTLATRQELTSALSGQAEQIESLVEQLRTAAQEFQTAMEAATEEETAQLSQTMEQMKRQAGSLNEQFSWAISQEQERMKSRERRLFWLSLIPTLTLLLWALARLWLPLP